MFVFDGENRLILIEAGATQIRVSDLYSRWKQWAATADNAKFLPAFENSVGGNPLGGGAVLGSYYFLANGWLIRPDERDHQLQVQGNLFPSPDTAPLFTKTLGNYNVAILMQTSSLTQVVTGSVGAGVIADAVWSSDLSPSQTQGTAADVLKRANSNAAVSAALSA